MRASASLDGIWQARLDPDDVGIGEGWANPSAPFDRELPVPLPWQAAASDLRQYAGIVWYRRSFRVPTTWRGRTIAVRFGAVDYEARVWLNRRELGSHAGGYTPFEVELDQALAWDADNWLTLRVHDPADLDEIPHGKQGGRWYTPISGPWQSVSLVARPSVRITRLRCYPDTVRGTVRVAADCALAQRTGYRLELAVLDPEGGQPVVGAVAAVETDVPRALVELPIPSPTLWSPAAPVLYPLRATLRGDDGRVLDVLEEMVGLRTIEARGGQIFLNGRPLHIRGALDQGYWPETLYTNPSDEAIEREIRLAQEMGLNLLRKHLKPEDPRYLDAADRLGMLIWAEPANCMRFTPFAREAVRRDLREMIDRDFNRPSVIIWGLYNEDWGLPDLWSDAEKQSWLAELYREVKSLDPTRLVCDDSGWAHVVTDLNDYHEYSAAPEWLARFRRRLDFIIENPEDNFAQGHLPTGEPMLITEFGQWALADPAEARRRGGGADPPWFAYNRAYTQPAGLPPPLPQNPLAEPLKTVTGFEDRFRSLGLAQVFGTTEALTEHAQRRAFRALKAHVEEMRRRPELAGYIVTEFSDIEWEANGWLDYWREPKSFCDELADINADVALIARPARPNAWGGENVLVQLYVANTTGRPVDGVVRWWLEDADLAGETPVSAAAYETVSLPTAVRLRAPDDRPRAARLNFDLWETGTIRARTYAELAIAPRQAGRVLGTRANGHSLDRLFRQRLEKQGYRVPRSFNPDLGLAITNRLDEQLWAYAHAGGRVLYLASTAGAGAELAGLRFDALSLAESWRIAAGVAWARVDRLTPAPIRAELGWEVANIFPDQSIEVATLKPTDELLAGWFEGWLANAGAFAALRRVGEGRVLVTTFRFEDSYGLDPVATLLLNRLTEIILES